MVNTEKDFPKYVGDKIRERMEHLGISQYRLLKDYTRITHPTLTRLLRGSGSTNISILAQICDTLGLEIIIKPKTNGTFYPTKLTD